MAPSRQILAALALVLCCAACLLGEAHGSEQPVPVRKLMASCGPEVGCSACTTPVSYLNSCDTPSFSGCKISAACKAPNGDKTFSTVDTSKGCNSIDNILGQLKCQ